MKWSDLSNFNWTTIRASLVVLAAVSMAAYVCAEEERSRQRQAAQNVRIAGDAMAKAMHWERVAAQDKLLLMRVQHLSMAASFVDMARVLASDAVIEQTSRVHVRAMASRIERELNDATSSPTHAARRARAAEDGEDPGGGGVRREATAHRPSKRRAQAPVDEPSRGRRPPASTRHSTIPIRRDALQSIAE